MKKADWLKTSVIAGAYAAALTMGMTRTAVAADKGTVSV